MHTPPVKPNVGVPVEAPTSIPLSWTGGMTTEAILACCTAIERLNGARDQESHVALIEHMAESCADGTLGDQSEMQLLLCAQAQVLNTIFCKFTGGMAKAERINELQAYGALALKAQNSCRKTIAAIAELKNPKRAVFIKNTAVNQQVNFNAKNSQNPTNELLSG